MGLGCDELTMPRCARARLDIDDFVSWDIDYLKVDGCQQFDELHMNGSYVRILSCQPIKSSRAIPTSSLWLWRHALQP
jgi:hypothetical protein